MISLLFLKLTGSSSTKDGKVIMMLLYQIKKNYIWSNNIYKNKKLKLIIKTLIGGKKSLTTKQPIILIFNGIIMQKLCKNHNKTIHHLPLKKI